MTKGKPPASGSDASDARAAVLDVLLNKNYKVPLESVSSGQGKGGRGEGGRGDAARRERKMRRRGGER
jgi:hypothetical protein